MHEPCQLINPIVEKMADRYQAKTPIGKINIDTSPLLAEKYNIKRRSIPAFVCIKKGQVIDQHEGLHSEKDIVGMLEKLNKP